MEADIEIRPCRGADWPAIDDIIRRIWHIGADAARERRYGFLLEGKPWQVHKTENVRRAVEAHPENWFVTELDRRVIGFCSLSVNPQTGIGVVGQNGLHPDYHGKGYGTRQLQFVLDEMRRRGMKIAEVTTGLDEGHAPARRLYERAGFQPLFATRIYTLGL